MDIKIHENEMLNLCSIRGIWNNFEGNHYLARMLLRVFNTTGYISVFARRRNYDVSFIENRVKDLEDRVFDLEGREKQLGLSFYYYGGDNWESVLWILVDMWFAFEHVAFSFFLSENDLKENLNLTLSHRSYWTHISESAPSYTLFRGVEEDVIWIGKSSSLDFDFLE